MSHPTDCPCVRCNPGRCPECGLADYTTTEDRRCSHRRACEARQMLVAGMDWRAAANHAQGVPDE